MIWDIWQGMSPNMKAGAITAILALIGIPIWVAKMTMDESRQKKEDAQRHRERLRDFEAEQERFRQRHLQRKLRKKKQ